MKRAAPVVVDDGDKSEDYVPSAPAKKVGRKAAPKAAPTSDDVATLKAENKELKKKITEMEKEAKKSEKKIERLETKIEKLKVKPKKMWCLQFDRRAI